MKVVFDTNVWVSALITPGGVAARLLALLEHFQSVTSEEILAEVEKVLHYDKIQKKRGLSVGNFPESIKTPGTQNANRRGWVTLQPTPTSSLHHSNIATTSYSQG